MDSCTVFQGWIGQPGCDPGHAGRQEEPRHGAPRRQAQEWAEVGVQVGFSLLLSLASIMCCPVPEHPLDDC